MTTRGRLFRAQEANCIVSVGCLFEPLDDGTLGDLVVELHGVEIPCCLVFLLLPETLSVLLQKRFRRSEVGDVLVGNAEAVSAMVLMQLVSPGAPVFQALLVSGMNPQSADYIVSSPEKYLCNVAAVQMAHDWGVPSLAGTFGVDAPEPDTWQLGRDSVYTALLCALAGTDISIGLGMLKASTLLVPEQIIFDDEIYHINRILAQGLDTSAEGLGLDVIQAVSSDGHYLGQKHTRVHLRQRWIPKLTHPLPSLDGSPLPDIRQRAKDEFDRILTQHQPEPLASQLQKELNKILEVAQKEIGI